MTAKVDSAAVQDGFELYLLGFVVADDGRRCRWRNEPGKPHGPALSLAVGKLVEAPHAAIDGRSRGAIVNLSDRRAGAWRARRRLRGLGQDRIVREVAAPCCRILSCRRITTCGGRT